MENQELAELTRLSAELERLAAQLGRLGGPPAAERPKKLASGERPGDRLRHRLHQARRARGLRQSDVAERLDRPQSFVSNFERGVRRLEVSEFIEIAQILGLDPAALVAELSGED